VLHNAAMAQLWDLGVRGTTLDVVAAWKESLLLVALLVVAWHVRRFPPVRAADVLAASYAVIVLVYLAIPQDVLGGEATSRGELLALRHHLFPVAAYALGRLAAFAWEERGRLGGLIVLSALIVAVVGLADLAFVPLHAWRESGVPGWYREQLGLRYVCLSGLPENWIFNTGDEDNPIRRLVSTFLSPLASGYLVVVALVVAATWRRGALALSAVVLAGLLWTFSRSSLVALAVALVVLAVLRRSALLVGGAVVVLAVAVAWAHVFPHVGPTGRFTPADLRYQHHHAGKGPTGSFSAVSENEPSLHEHWTSLKDGARTVVHHPQGFGLGNVGQVASRTNTPLKAGESNYTELGVELGLLGSVLWIAWGIAVLWGLVRARAFRICAAFAAVLALAVQTDVIGDPWVAYCVWALAGAALLMRTRPKERLADAAPAP
jgi:hypothetical protein